MNPQYLPPQFGGPAQGFPPPASQRPPQFPPPPAKQMDNPFAEDLKSPQPLGQVPPTQLPPQKFAPNPFPTLGEVPTNPPPQGQSFNQMPVGEMPPMPPRAFPPMPPGQQQNFPPMPPLPAQGQMGVNRPVQNMPPMMQKQDLPPPPIQGQMPPMGNQTQPPSMPNPSLPPPPNSNPMFRGQNVPPGMPPPPQNQHMPPSIRSPQLQDNLNHLNGMMPPPGPNQVKPHVLGGAYPPPPSGLYGPGQFTSPNVNQRPMPPHGPFNSNLPGAMQDLSLGPQHPTGPPKPLMNGENMPPMPPINQQYQPQGNYLNGQQLKSPTYPSGYPPQPPQVQGGYTPQYQQQQQQQRRLDPDQMPSPIMVMQDDERTRSGLFYTNQKGLVPPLVTTKFVVQDQGNCSPRYVRSTMYNVPITQDLMKETSIPFGLVISPMARTEPDELIPPIVNFGELGPVRCTRCKAYMCPFMQFIDSGRRFQCLFCKATTDVPSEYFAHLDHTGQRIDRQQRAELSLGTYELIATKDYCRNNIYPNPPAIVFIIDVSYNSVKSGLVPLLCSQMKEIVRNLPIDQGMEKSNMRIGFITFDSTVHFYNIKGSLAAPQIMIVGDVQDMFMPLLDGFLCTPEESETVIDSLMEQIPTMFCETKETQTVLLPAILAGLEALKASDCSGKLIVFCSSLPIAEAPGKLKNRDDRKLLGTDKEKTVLTPQTQAYNQLGQDCVASGCSVDLFVLNNSYIDIATIGQVARLSGGEVYKYTYFQADLDGERLIQDVVTNISRPIAFDAIMRVRTSTGVRPTDFYGHFFMSNTTDMELGSIDCNKAVSVEIKHDDKLQEDEGVYVQVALLYTSCSGQRRLRILNLSLKTCSQMTDLYRSCDLDTMINFFSKQATYKLLDNTPKLVKDTIVNRSAQILANYRKKCATPSSAGQLILPECMKLLPLYVNCLLKSDALSGGSDMTIDDRAFVMQAVMIMDVPSSVKYFYPRLIPLHEINPDESINIPAPQRCSIEKMQHNGMYLLENGIHMMLWIGIALDPEICEQVFGVPTPAQINADVVNLPTINNPLSLAVREVIALVKAANHRCMRLTLVKQKDKLEPVFKHFLVEDRGLDASPSYVEFLCHMHKEIRNILS